MSSDRFGSNRSGEPSVIRAADTFTYDPAMTADQAREAWIVKPPGLTVVAVDGVRVVGTAHMNTTRLGPGAHVCTAGFMVAAGARGRGIGTMLCRYALDRARRRGYAGMRFNAVAASNHAALGVYLRQGFDVVGTVPTLTRPWVASGSTCSTRSSEQRGEGGQQGRTVAGPGAG